MEENIYTLMFNNNINTWQNINTFFIYNYMNRYFLYGGIGFIIGSVTFRFLHTDFCNYMERTHRVLIRPSGLINVGTMMGFSLGLIKAYMSLP